MRRALLRVLACAAVLAGLALTYAVVGRVVASHDVLEAAFGERRLWVPALLALLFGVRLFLVIVGPAWLLLVTFGLASTAWKEKGRALVSSRRK